MEPDISSNTEELSRKVADWMILYINEVLDKQDRFTIALSGGNTPKKLYQLLATPAYSQKIPWEKLHFFWGDERFVPADDERNNAHMAFEHLLDHVPVNRAQVFVMRTDIEPAASAEAYQEILKKYFTNTESSFDLVLLGLGDDAHTLSLFPGYPVIHERVKWVDSFYLTQQEMYRITLTAPIVNRASFVLFLVAGADKAFPVYKVLYGQHDPDLYPAQMIQPYYGKCKWYLDRSAASELEIF